MYDSVAYLLSETKTVNDIGDTISVPVERKVYVDSKSARQSEFYQAQAVGLRAEIMFEMRRTEYNGEQRIKYDEEEYDIIRTYKKNNDFIELVGQGITNKNGVS